MGKNKGKQKRKTEAIFKVAGHNSLKAKGRTKPVKSNLKQVNVTTREQVHHLDEKLKEMRELVTVVKKKSLENFVQMETEGKAKKKEEEKSREIPFEESVETITDQQRTMQIQ